MNMLFSCSSYIIHSVFVISFYISIPLSDDISGDLIVESSSGIDDTRSEYDMTY